jgi:hypothetical protein
MRIRGVFGRMSLLSLVNRFRFTDWKIEIGERKATA